AAHGPHSDPLPASEQRTPFPAPGRPALERRRGRRRRGRLLWRIFVAVVGAIALVVCSGMALGIVSVGNTGSALDGPPGADQPAPSAEAVPGLDGVYPGGAARSVPVTVHNEADVPFEITAVRPELSGVPARCPAAAWRIAVSAALPTVPPGGRSTVSLPVTLAPGAPDGCQSITVTVPVIIEGLQHRDAGAAEAGPTPSVDVPPSLQVPPSPEATATPATIRSAAAITTATLGSPVTSLAVRGSQVAVSVGRPASGPAPDGYQVDVLAASGRRSLCRPTAPGSCVDSVPAAADRSYLAAARLGEHWVREAPTKQAWTAPPAPQLSFTDGDQPSDSALTLDAAGGANGYDVALYVDGSGSPFHTERVAAGARLSLIVEPPGYGPGKHRIVAVSSFHGRRTSSRTLRLTTTTDVEPTSPFTVAPEPPGPTPIENAPAPTTTSTPSTSTAAPLPAPEDPAGAPAAAALQGPRQGP
ncbi:MAG TPA: hypothetical protein VHN80_12580, partial [Kineosporiaceae bacterium]|nr:hypothetical protein [Kineosporiaceae bacterium]